MKNNIPSRAGANRSKNARVSAGEEGASISDSRSQNLNQTVCERKTYSQARRRALDRLRAGFNLRWTAPTSRQELHDR